MPNYKIGNILRGYMYFPANDDQEAWDSGREAFNTAIPTDSKSGRQIELYVEKPVQVTHSYREGKNKNSTTGWFPVLVGMSKDPFPEPHPPKPAIKN